MFGEFEAQSLDDVLDPLGFVVDFVAHLQQLHCFKVLLLVEGRVVRVFGHCAHPFWVVGSVHLIHHTLQVNLSLLVRNRQFGVEEFREDAEGDGSRLVLFADDVGVEGRVFEEENDGVAADGASVVGADAFNVMDT